MRIARGALKWGAAAALPAVGLTFLIRGGDAALSAGIALGIVLVNAGLAAAISGLAGRISATAAAMISLPSFALRMIMIFLALVWLQSMPAIDRPIFAAAFAAGVVTVVALEARNWRRTPWLATTFGTVRTETEDES